MSFCVIPFQYLRFLIIINIVYFVVNNKLYIYLQVSCAWFYRIVKRIHKIKFKDILEIGDMFYNKYIKHCTLYSVHCTLYSVQCILYTVQCTVYIVHCTVYIENISLYAHKVIFLYAYIWFILYAISYFLEIR